VVVQMDYVKHEARREAIIKNWKMLIWLQGIPFTKTLSEAIIKNWKLTYLLAYIYSKYPEAIIKNWKQYMLRNRLSQIVR